MNDAEFAEIIKDLPEETRQKLIDEREILIENSRRAAAAAIIARNFSHNSGKYWSDSEALFGN